VKAPGGTSFLDDARKKQEFFQGVVPLFIPSFAVVLFLDSAEFLPYAQKSVFSTDMPWNLT